MLVWQKPTYLTPVGTSSAGLGAGHRGGQRGFTAPRGTQAQWGRRHRAAEQPAGCEGDKRQVLKLKLTLKAKEPLRRPAVPSLPPPYRCFPEKDGCVGLTLNILFAALRISSVSLAAPERSSPDAHPGFTLSPLGAEPGAKPKISKGKMQPELPSFVVKPHDFDGKP